MKKKILFIEEGLGVGGAEKSLLTILQNFEYHESFSQLSIHLIVVANLRHNCVTPKCSASNTFQQKCRLCATFYQINQRSDELLVYLSRCHNILTH